MLLTVKVVEVLTEILLHLHVLVMKDIMKLAYKTVLLATINVNLAQKLATIV